MERVIRSTEWFVRSKEWTVRSVEWLIRSKEWVIHSKEWTVHSKEWAIHSASRTAPGGREGVFRGRRVARGRSRTVRVGPGPAVDGTEAAGEVSDKPLDAFQAFIQLLPLPSLIDALATAIASVPVSPCVINLFSHRMHRGFTVRGL